jgi:hypothetical protein
MKIINPFQLLDFNSPQIQNQVIEIIVTTFKKVLNPKVTQQLYKNIRPTQFKNQKKRIANELISQLLGCFQFDFNSFCRKHKISQTDQSHFLTYLLYGIYYNEISIFQLAKASKKESLTGFFLVLLAECISSPKIRKILCSLQTTERLFLICHCCHQVREGSWSILKMFESIYQKEGDWKDFLSDLRSKYYDVEYFSVLLSSSVNQTELTVTDVVKHLEENSQKNVKKILEHMVFLKETLRATTVLHKEFDLEVKKILLEQTYSFEELCLFFKVFGLKGYYLGIPLAKTPGIAFDQILQIILEILTNPLLCESNSYKVSVLFILQFYRQLYAFHRLPNQYISGLKRLVYALPTRGNQLSSLPWIPSLLSALQTLTQHLQSKGYSHLESHPIIIFDQAASAQLKKNRVFTSKLSSHYQRPIVHLSTQQTIRLADRLGLKNWIKTSDENNFGYGGARNCVFLLAPVIFELFSKGKKNFKDLIKTNVQDLKSIYDRRVLGKNKEDLIIHMGEDDVDLPLSHSFFDTLFADLYKNEYFSRPVYCIGRATHEINPFVDLESLLDNPASLYFSTRWNPIPESGRMKGMLTKPRFCLPLPFGNEELHVIPPHYVSDYFHQPIVHFSGTRFPNKFIPISPYDGILKYLQSYLMYSFQICLSSCLLDPSNQRGKCIFPWNDPVVRKTINFKNLHELWDYVALDKTQKELRCRFWKNLEELVSNNEDLLSSLINRLASIDPGKSPLSLKRYYSKIQQEALTLKELCERIVHFHSLQPLNFTGEAIRNLTCELKITKTSLAYQFLMLFQCIFSLCQNQIKNCLRTKILSCNDKFIYIAL